MADQKISDLSSVTPADTDSLPVARSGGTNGRYTWSAVKTALQTLFDSSYATASQGSKADTALQPASITGAATKTTLVDADSMPVVDSEAGGAIKRVTIANLRSSVSGGGNEYATWAALLAATGTLTVGRVYVVTGEIVSGGARGTQWVWTGSMLRPACRQSIYYSATRVDGASGSTAEQFLASILIPGSLLLGVRRFVVNSKIEFSATDTNGKSLRIRLGAAGSSSDTVLMQSINAAANLRVIVFPLEMAVVNSTTLRGFGQNPISSANSPDTYTTSVTAAAADVTVTDLATDQYLSVSIQQGASPLGIGTLSMFNLTVQ